MNSLVTICYTSNVLQRSPKVKMIIEINVCARLLVLTKWKEEALYVFHGLLVITFTLRFSWLISIKQQ